MSIKQMEYTKNKELTLSELESYTKKIVPELEQEYQQISFVYESEGVVLGRIVGFIHWDHLQIELFYVSNNTQGQGIGTKLLNHVESIAKQQNKSYIFLETMSFNAPKFYEKHGYEVVGKIVNSPMENQIRFFYKKDIYI
ncbi:MULTISPECIES: GNAT family N-acetyltransferase [Enterococcus]|nr:MULTISPECIES: GNAT family N-acetyltransferase [unclassified Enterococcus]MBO0489474.1 GNAT family N-acetyltransferase [Enterococcus sp. DIV1094]MBO1300153.1 GNAT family N-acetyltransferase [Enterococcus sp. DIV1271a]